MAIQALSDVVRGGVSAFLAGGGAAPTPGTKTLVYTNGVLTSVNGPGATTKTLAYTNGALTQVQAVSGGVTTTKTLAYTNGSLTSVATAIA